MKLWLNITYIVDEKESVIMSIRGCDVQIISDLLEREKIQFPSARCIIKTFGGLRYLVKESREEIEKLVEEHYELDHDDKKPWE